METLAERYQRITARIQKAIARSRDRHDVTLIAVGKGHPASLLQELYALGHRDFGENYIQELADKAQTLPDVRWHFIGRLQSNKLSVLLRARPHVIHTLSSLDQVNALARRWANPLPLAGLIQVNLDQSPTKGGVTRDQAFTLLRELHDSPSSTKVKIQGLMAIPDPGARSFAAIRDLADALTDARLLPAPPHRILSLGMSEDFEDAIFAGATHVRIGTAIFGARSG